MTLANLTCCFFASIMCVVLSCSISAQDPLFSQYYINSVIHNPAFAGINGGSSVSMAARNQWLGYNNAYNTVALSFDRSFGRSSAFGLVVQGDRVGGGLLSTSQLKGMYASEVRIDGKNYIKGALEVGVGYSYLDRDRFIFGDALDPRFGNVTPAGVRLPTKETLSSRSSSYYVDMGMGILYYNDIFYGGIALKHLNRAKVTYSDESRLPLQFNVQGGMQLELEKNAFISPNVMFAYAQGAIQYTLGSYMQLEGVFFGAWFRRTRYNFDAIIANLGIRYDNWKIGYSYDYTISSLGNVSFGSHELAISYLIFDRKDRSKDFDDCFDIFR